VSARTIRELLGDAVVRSGGQIDVSVSGIAYRSGVVSAGDAFFCIPGFTVDGHEFADEAVRRGAVALVVQRELPGVDVPQYVVGSTRAALAKAAAVFLGQPSTAMDVVGITGTNGKTTTTYLVDSIMRAAGRLTGVIGTVETRIGDSRQPSVRTTPESSDLQALLACMRDAGVSGVAMEVSSHALALHRVDRVRFAVAAFTNLTQDHLDYHHTLEEYWSVKRRLLTEFDVAHRVVNIDDPLGAELAEDLEGCITVGRAPQASIRAKVLHASASGTTFELITEHGSRTVEYPLAGDYNVSNALVAAGTGIALGIDVDTVAAGLTSAAQVPGRLERIECGQPFSVIVDYAHTPDSIDKALRAVRSVTAGRVIVVFGCGGDRDPDKRAPMGRAAGRSADFVVATSDNPRSEDPVGILLQVEDGLREVHATYEVHVDRRAAIARALAFAEPGDSVVIAGKGHEDYQIFADRTVHFDDREVAREELGARC
jgi:UDP-N-acetylmuramoyl-L-alanyl-D-glutamate--2,6-diaminopimelate ligase